MKAKLTIPMHISKRKESQVFQVGLCQYVWLCTCQLQDGMYGPREWGVIVSMSVIFQCAMTLVVIES